jgi:hypothetical protein
MIKLGDTFICKENWNAYELIKLYHSFKIGDIVTITYIKSEGDYRLECNANGKEIYLKHEEVERYFRSSAEYRESQIKSILDD